jgi:hypothetical protein
MAGRRGNSKELNDRIDNEPGGNSDCVDGDDLKINNEQRFA